jgi:hypothetical protein
MNHDRTHEHHECADEHDHISKHHENDHDNCTDESHEHKSHGANKHGTHDHGHSHAHMESAGKFESRKISKKRKYDSRAFGKPFL